MKKKVLYSKEYGNHERDESIFDDFFCLYVLFYDLEKKTIIFIKDNKNYIQ